MSALPLRFSRTKESWKPVVPHVLRGKLKYAYFAYCLLGAGGIIGLFIWADASSPAYSYDIAFLFVLYLLWKSTPKTNKKLAERMVDSAWKNLPSGTMYLELDDNEGLKKVFTPTDSPEIPQEKIKLTKIETICGKTVIFCDLGKHKNQIWFVVNEDITGFLRTWTEKHKPAEKNASNAF